MSDNDPRRWLPDDLFAFSTVFLVALALLLTSRLWLHIHPHNQHQPLTLPESGLIVEQKDHKSTRSKERRRRGKDPFRDLLKGGKKSKAILNAIKAADHTPSAELESLPGNDTTSSTSRSQSPEPTQGISEATSRMATGSDDSSTSNTSATAAPPSGNVADHCPPGACSRVPDAMTATDAQVNISSVSTVTEHASIDSPSSPRIPAPCTDICTPQPHDSQQDSTSGSCAKFVRARTRLRVLRIDPTKSSTPPPDSVANPLHPLHGPPLSAGTSTHPTDSAASSTPTNSRGSTPPSPSRSPPKDLCNGGHEGAQIASMRSALEVARLREEQLRQVADHASKERDELRWRWSEDASAWRMRESELQSQINHLMQQLQAHATVASFQPPNPPSSCFSSPTSPHARMSPHSPYHPLASFPLPLPIQPQNSASAPAHVRALLASTPMLTSHPAGFASHASGGLYSGAGLGMSPLLWSGMGLCGPNQDPRHSGRRTPDSSASGSSSRGRGRRRSAENVKSASDDSSLGDWDGLEDGSGDEGPWEEEEDIFENNVLADAILKRPESLRKLSGGVGMRSGRTPNGCRPPAHGMEKMGQADAEKMDALEDPAVEKHAFAPPLVDTLAVRTAT